jgi:hypothetical protein
LLSVRVAYLARSIGAGRLLDKSYARRRRKSVPVWCPLGDPEIERPPEGGLSLSLQVYVSVTFGGSSGGRI